MDKVAKGVGMLVGFGGPKPPAADAADDERINAAAAVRKALKGADDAALADALDLFLDCRSEPEAE